MQITSTLTNLSAYGSLTLSNARQNNASPKPMLSTGDTGTIPVNSVRNNNRTYLLTQTLRYDLQNSATKNLIGTYSEVEQISDIFSSSDGQTNDKIKSLLEADSGDNNILTEIQSQLAEQVNGYWQSETIAIPANASQSNSIPTNHNKDSLKLGPALKTTYISYSEEEKISYIANNQDEIMKTILSVCTNAIENKTNSHTSSVNYGYAQPTDKYDEYCEKTASSSLGFLEIENINDMGTKAKAAIEQLNMQLKLDVETRNNFFQEAKKYGDIHFTYA